MASYQDNRNAILVTLVLSLFLTASCSKGAGLDSLTHKETTAGARKVLVNRFTGNVNYYWTDGRWERPQQAARTTLQALYDKDKSSGR